MTFEEIKEKIENNNREIENLFDPTIFVLNKRIVELRKENEELEKKLKEFKNGSSI